jgi:TonB family protein
MTLRELISWTALFGASLGLHAGAFAKLNGMVLPATAKVETKPTFMEMTATSKPPAPAAEAPSNADKPSARAPRRLAAAAPRPTAPTAARPAPPPAAETLADFSGTTLTNEGAGAGWASATGNGERMAGPIGRPGAKVTGRHVDLAAPDPRPAAPAAVAVADLSRRPEAPRLEEALERNYPAEARQGGQSGRAVVRARITADGEVRDILVQSETSAGFGRACRDTLAGSRWTPPLDRDGRPVATIIHYTCRFEVR